MLTTIMPSHALRAVAALGACAAINSSALADSTAPDVASVIVSVRDLDLGNDGDARLALQRIKAAAREVCGDAPSIKDLTREALYRSCVDEAVERSVQTLGAAKVTALLRAAPNPYRLASRP